MKSVKAGVTQLPNEMLETIIAMNLTGAELRVLLFIIRKTIGWQKVSDSISYSQIQKATGLCRMSVMRSLKTLESASCVIIDKKESINRYELNTGEWQNKSAKTSNRVVTSNIAVTSNIPDTKLVTNMIPTSNIPDTKLVTGLLPTKENTKETKKKKKQKKEIYKEKKYKLPVRENLIGEFEKYREYLTKLVGVDSTLEYFEEYSQFVQLVDYLKRNYPKFVLDNDMRILIEKMHMHPFHGAIFFDFGYLRRHVNKIIAEVRNEVEYNRMANDLTVKLPF